MLQLSRAVVLGASSFQRLSFFFELLQKLGERLVPVQPVVFSPPIFLSQSLLLQRGLLLRVVIPPSTTRLLSLKTLPTKPQLPSLKKLPTKTQLPSLVTLLNKTQLPSNTELHSKAAPPSIPILSRCSTFIQPIVTPKLKVRESPRKR